MKRKYLLSATIVMVAMIIGIFILLDNTTTVYIVRHAEKDIAIFNNPPLTNTGVRRAIDLANLLKSENIGFIYSTDSLRTKSTARPLADTLGLGITIYPIGTTPVNYSSLPLLKKKNILIVGHSETILNIFRNLGASPRLVSINSNDYDNLLVVTIHRTIFSKWATSLETVYGAPSP